MTLTGGLLLKGHDGSCAGRNDDTDQKAHSNQTGPPVQPSDGDYRLLVRTFRRIDR